jgi:hypothetical protein
MKNWTNTQGETFRFGGLGLFLLTFALLVPCVLRAQEAKAEPEQVEVVDEEGEFVPEDAGESSLGLTADATDFSSIQDILSLDEEVMNDPGLYSYDPGARRDPFQSLVERRKGQQGPVDEERPEGPAGMLIDEIAVEGVFILPDGPVAQIQSVGQGTSFLLRPGDQLWDGDVVSISFREVVFKQSVDDPTALKPFREVVKRLEP